MTKEEIKNLTDQYKYVQSRVYDIKNATRIMEEAERYNILNSDKSKLNFLECVKSFYEIDEQGFVCFIQKKMMEFGESFIAEKTKELEEYNVSTKGESHESWEYGKCIKKITHIIDRVRSGSELLIKIGHIERYEVLNYPVDRKDLLKYLESQKEYVEKQFNKLTIK